MNTKTVHELRSITLHKGRSGNHKLNKADLVALLLEKSSEEMPTLAPSHENVPRWIRKASEHLKTAKICNEVVARFSYTLRYVPDHLKTEEMCSQAISTNP